MTTTTGDAPGGAAVPSTEANISYPWHINKINDKYFYYSRQEF
jgi:hypothetical protein